MGYRPEIRGINSSSAQIGKIVFFISLISLSIFAAKLITIHSPLVALALTGGLIVSVFTLFNTNLALIILIFSMLLSPEIPIAQVPGRDVVIRLDDIIIIFMFFSWLAKMAVNQQLKFLRKTPLNRPLAVYVFIYILSTVWGVFEGRVQPLKSIFYLLKYTEYFFIFYLFANNLRTLRQAKTFILVLFLTAIPVCIYALSTLNIYDRATAPFEGKEGEANTLAGYLVLVTAVALGQFIYSRSSFYRFFIFFLISLIVPAFLFTLSRGGYVGFVVMYLTLTFLTRRSKLILTGFLSLMVISVIIYPQIVPVKVKARLMHTFDPTHGEFAVGSRAIPIEESAAQRIEVWSWAFDKFKEKPLLGWGVSGAGLVDSQMALVVTELGIFGTAAFLWLLLTILRSCLKNLRTLKDNFAKGLTIGFTAGFFGLLIHSFAANIFIIVRIMEPFWFLAAVIIVLPELTSEREEAGEDAV